MRVLYVVSRFPCRSERFVVREIAGLAALGVEIRVLAIGARAGDEDGAAAAVAFRRRPAWWDPRLWAGALSAALARPTVAARVAYAAWRTGRREGRGGRARAFRLAVLALAAASRLRARDTPDLIHAHFATAPATFAFLTALALRRPWGFSIHARDLYAEPAALELKTRAARHVIACSRAAAADTRRRLPPAFHDRVHAVSHGLDLREWRRAMPSRDPAATPLILAAGRLEPKKGIAILVDACALLRDQGRGFRCEIVGEGAERDALAARVGARGLEDAVVLRPWLPEHALRLLYQEAVVVVVPSVVAADGDRDNVPNVLLEALATGVPVVASALPGIAEIASGGAPYLVSPGDPVELARALEEICADPVLARRLADAGRALVEASFDAQTTTRQLRDVLARSLAPRDGARSPDPGAKRGRAGPEDFAASSR